MSVLSHSGLFGVVGMHFANDAKLGPNIDSGFDFTLSFEDVVFTIVPSAIFACFLPYYAWTAKKSPRIVRPGFLFWAKMALGIVLCMTQIASVAIWANTEEFRTDLGIAARTLSCFASLCALFAIYVEHSRSIRPSLLLELYLILTVLFDIVKIRSLFLRNVTTDGAVTIASVVTRFLLVLLEEFPKRSLFISEKEKDTASREAVGGLCSRAFFLWLNPLFSLGSKTRITLQDLDSLDKPLQVDVVNARFQRYWEKEDKSSKLALFKATFRTIGIRQLILPIGLSLLNVAAQFSQPFIIKRVVTVMGLPTIDNNQANGLIGATLLAYLSFGVTRATYRQTRIRCMTILRNCVMSAIFDQVLVMYAADLESGAVLARMSTDVEGMALFLLKAIDAIPNLASLVVGIVYLGYNIGIATFLVAIPLFASTVLAWVVGLYMKPAQKEWNSKIENRLSATKGFLSNIKTIRMTGLTSILSDTIRNKLNIEVDASKDYRFYWSFIFAIELSSLAITPALILVSAFFWTRRDAITAADVYAIITVINLIVGPLGIIAHSFPPFARGLAGHDRIQEFLFRKPRTEYREIPAEVTSDEIGNGAASDEKVNSAIDQSARLVQIQTTTDGDSKHVFNTAEAFFPAGQLTAIVGPIGSGKSTLLKLLIGELPCAQGRVKIDVSQVGYCSQTPWIRNQSVREFIVGYMDQDDVWYQSIIQACGLDIDFSSWPQGDQTKAGSNGHNLSGGQKHRIALARAIFSRKRILILDDIFSGLDRNTSRKIFEALFGTHGLLRKTETTVILATNMVEHLEYADSVLGISKDHSISQLDKATAMSTVKLSDFSASNTDDSATTVSETTEPIVLVKDDATNDARPIPPDRTAYKYYLTSFGVVSIVVWLICVALGEAFFKSPNIFLRVWLDTHALEPRLFLGFSLLSLASVFTAVFIIWYWFVKLAPISYDQIHNNLLDATAHATSQFLSTTDNGSLLNRFSNDMSLISQDLPFAFMYAVMFFFAVWVDLGIIASGAYYVAAIFPIFLGALYYVQRYYLRTSRQMRVIEIESRAPLVGLINEVIDGIEQIRTFGWTSAFRADLMTRLESSQKAYYMMMSIQQWLLLALDLSVLVLATALVAIALHLPHSSSANGIGLALVNMISLSQEMSLCIKWWAEAETCIGAVTRTLDFVKTTPQEIQDAETQVGPSWPEKGEIVFSDMSAKYSRTDSDTTNVLSDVSLTVEAGKKVGIVGRTGSGKSTLFMTILQMVPYEGSIKIDGTELCEISQDIIRAKITTLTQSSMLLSGSVRLNINPSEQHVEDASIIAVLERLDIWAHVEANGGLEADISDIPLSDGQKQVLNIARGVVHHQRTGSKVALMDEITSQVDYETDRTIQEVVNSEFKDCTVLVIAHRAETLHDADTILTVADGKVVQQ